MDSKKIGERLMRLRQDKKLSQADFAKRLGASPGAYQHYERGEREIPSSLLWALLTEFEVDPLWMISDEDEAQQPRQRPRHDLDLLMATGMAVERVIAEQRVSFSDTKKWEIICLAYKLALAQAKPDGTASAQAKVDDSMISALVSIGGN